MASSETASDPAAEYDKSRRELASLERQFEERKLQQEEYELLSKQLKDRISRAESQMYAMARKDEALARKLRLRSYTDPAVQQVITHFLSSQRKSLEPEFGIDRLPRYPAIDEKGNRIDAERTLLQRMADIRILNATLFERLLSCPRCGTPSNVYLRFKCAQCGSIDISINRMLEHLTCGTIHQESAFHVGKSLICPTCKKLIQGADEYRLIGVVCSCNACHAHFEDPVQTFFCRKCNFDFDLPTGTIVDVFAYDMSKEALKEARQLLGVSVLGTVLSSSGFEVKTPGLLVGPNKEVEFALLTRKNEKTIALDISQSDSEVEVEPVLELYVKILEANPNAAILGVIPRLSKRARDVASLHNILIAEGTNATELGKKVLELLNAI
jgi:transposase-like protein